MNNFCRTDFFLTPLQVRTLGTKKVADIWAGEFSTYCKVRSGPIWVCGLNNYGQLGKKVLFYDDRMKLQRDS